MKYAIIGDLHSSVKDTRAVLAQIKECGLSNSILALGDLYECTIGKKKLASLTSKLLVEDAAIISEQFEELITFPSIIGNQEERIALVTGEEKFLNYPEKFEIEHALLMHGHQFTYNDQFELLTPSFDEKLLFFGHSHHAALYINGIRTLIEHDLPYDLSEGQTIVNVGSVIQNREWCIYDSETLTVTFKQAK